MEKIAKELALGQKVLIKKFHLSTQMVKGKPKLLMIDELLSYEETDMPPEALLPEHFEHFVETESDAATEPEKENIGVGTSSIDPLLDLGDGPALLPPVVVVTKWCPQLRFVLGQIGFYTSSFNKKNHFRKVFSSQIR